jgi:hypothetical protein
MKFEGTAKQALFPRSGKHSGLHRSFGDRCRELKLETISYSQNPVLFVKLVILC